jgi:hypothetical protein
MTMVITTTILIVDVLAHLHLRRHIIITTPVEDIIQAITIN